MVKWIVQNNLIKPKILQELRDAFAELAIDFEEVLVIPFSSELPSFSPGRFTVFYGSTTLMLNAYASENYKNGVFYDSKKFTIQSYLKNWGEKMLNFDGKVLTFQAFVSEEVDQKSEWFIRPNEDDKSFAGTTMSSSEIKDWFEKIKGIDNPKLNAETLILASEKKKITREWRNFIVNAKVIETSRYMLNGALNISKEDCPDEMIKFTQEAAATFSPHDIFVMDIAETADGFRIIECNCFNGTGFYQHSIKKIIRSVTEQIIRKNGFN